MKTLRTIVWVLAAFAFLIFATYNWQAVELVLWQNLVLETKVPVLALLAFAAGFLPMWAYHRSITWNMSRRIRALETSLKNTAMAYRTDATAAAGAATSTATGGDKPVDKSGTDGGEEGNPPGIGEAGETGNADE